MTNVAALLLALLAAPQQTDTLVALDGATRLSVESPGGSIRVTTWDRPEVRVRASHSSRTFVDVDRRGNTIDIESEASRGPGGIVEYDITVPASLDLDLEGQYTTITVEGADGEVSAETMQGDIRIVGGRGRVNASSVNGRIDVEGAQGRVEIEAVGQPVRIVGATGEVYVESVGGRLTMENVRAQVVEVGSVGGPIEFEGPLSPTGRYFFGTHGGPVVLRLPAGTGANFTVATIHGTVRSDLAGVPDRFERGRRQTFTVGGGGAVVEIETFAGSISLLRVPAPEASDGAGGPGR